MNFRNRLITVLFINVMIGVSIFFGTDREQKINLRFALFSQQGNLSDFSRSPDELDLLGFHHQLPYIRARFNKNNRLKLDRLRIKGATTLSNLEKIKILVLMFSNDGAEGGCIERSDSLTDTIVSVAAGHGCCSDHSQTFIALAGLNGFVARELHNGLHSFNEYWDPTLGKWIWLDSQHALMAIDDTGSHLSLYEIHQQLKAGGLVKWDFFGTRKHRFSVERADAHPYYQSKTFGTLIMTLGNNIFQEDEWSRRLSPLPKAVQQFFLLAFGIKPGYLYYDDVINESKTFASRIRPYRYGFFLYLLGNCALILWVVSGWLIGKRRIAMV